jgi:hypothetical protein
VDRHHDAALQKDVCAAGFLFDKRSSLDMTRILRTVVLALAAMATLGVMASAASATQGPYYKVAGSKLEKNTETRTVLVKGEGNQILTNPTTKIKITCTALNEVKGALIIGGLPGTSSGQLVYSSCTVAENGAKCQLASGGKITKEVTTESLKDELAFGSKSTAKGTKLVDLFKPTTGSVFAKLEFVAEAGGECKNKSTSVEGAVVVEILNSKKEAVNVGEREAEEAFGFIKVVAGGEACTAAGVCTKGSLKAFGTASTLEGVAKAELDGKENFGVFTT